MDMKWILHKKAWLCLTLTLLFWAVSFQCTAYVPYDSYTYSTMTGEAKAQYCPTPYYPAFAIDSQVLGVTLVTPADMCFDKLGRLYIVDSYTNHLLVLDENYKLIANVDVLEDEAGQFEFLGGPSGIFVTEDMEIYICDTNQARILVLDENYKVKRIYKNIVPVNEQEEDYLFLPSKIVVDASKNMYVLVKNEYQGIMQLDREGTFISFIGSNKVTYNPLTRLWKKIMSKQQKEQMEQFLPVEYTNISQDKEGLIYAVSKAGTSDTVKRLNLAGKDVLLRSGYVNISGDQYQDPQDSSLFTDIVSDANDLIYVLDASMGRIFVYTNEGFPFYVFGGRGSQLGTFSSPTAIEINGTDILVADQGNPRITVFRRTEYAQLISGADEAYARGDYEESLELWRQVIKRNANFELAYAQIGKVYLRRNQYEEAMQYFLLGNYRGDKITNMTGYNKAFTEFRRETAARYLGIGVVVLLLLAILWRLWRILQRRRRKREEKN